MRRLAVHWVVPRRGKSGLRYRTVSSNMGSRAELVSNETPPVREHTNLYTVMLAHDLAQGRRTKLTTLASLGKTNGDRSSQSTVAPVE